MWQQYEPILSQYYNVNQYLEDFPIKYDPNPICGATKCAHTQIGNSGHQYVSMSTKIGYEIDITEATIHFDILAKFLQLKDTKGYIFNIPKIYKTTKMEQYMVIDKVIFSTTQNDNAKYQKFETLLDVCVAQGQYIDFIYFECGYDSHDVESYIDDNTHLLTFIDFGGFQKISPQQAVEISEKFKR